MRNRSQKILDVIFCADEGQLRHSQEGSMRDSYPMWKELFLDALVESDKEKLTKLLQATEQAMVLRAQELLNSADHHEERDEMAIALASLLAIKTHELGWPAVSARDGLS